MDTMAAIDGDDLYAARFNLRKRLDDGLAAAGMSEQVVASFRYHDANIDLRNIVEIDISRKDARCLTRLGNMRLRVDFECK